VQFIAMAAAFLLGTMAAIQVTLALGAPLGDATFGGSASTEDGVLTTGFRFLAGLQALILLAFAWIVLARAGVVQRGFAGERLLSVSTWIIAGFMMLNTLGNLSAPHPLERWGAGSLTLTLAILCSIIALYAPARSPGTHET
jgi:hypothetical protein